MPRWSILVGFDSAPSRCLLSDERGSFLMPVSNFLIFYFQNPGEGRSLLRREIFQGAKACVEFGRASAALAVEVAQKTGAAVPYARLAFHKDETRCG